MLTGDQRRWREFAQARKTSSDSEILAEYIGRQEVVLGVFKDKQYELGWAFYVIKGAQALMTLIHAGGVFPAAIGVIACGEFAEAVAMSQVYGGIRQSN
jgi:hypothetical protein